MIQRSGPLIFFVLLVMGGGPVASVAQEPRGNSAAETPSFCREEPASKRLDVQGLALVYCAEAPVVTRPLRGAHATARPVFFGAVPAAWLRAGLLQSDESVGEAYRLSLSQGLTYGLVTGVKHLVRRPRPYNHHALEVRTERYGTTPGRRDVLSFPSGHAGLSAAIVTSWSLSHPRWYVIGPGSVWAVGVALSRLYVGVHYPSDILTGAVVGTGVAALVHHFRTELTPSFLPAPEGGGAPIAPPVVLRIRF